MNHQCCLTEGFLRKQAPSVKEWSENCRNFRELSMLDPEPREVYNCHLCCFSDICIPLKNEIAWLYGRPHLKTNLLTKIPHTSDLISYVSY